LICIKTVILIKFVAVRVCHSYIFH